MDESLRDVHALLLVAVVIRGDRESGLLAAAQECLEQRVGGLASADVDRAVAAAPLVGTVDEGLHRAEVRQDVGVAPVLQPVGRPALVVHRVAAVEDHRVDGRRSTKYLSGLLVDRLPVQVRLWAGSVAPADPGVLIHERQRPGHGDEQAAIGAAGLD
jgi:hypothetical protein